MISIATTSRARRRAGIATLVLAAAALIAGACAAPPQSGDPADFGGTPTIPVTSPPFGDTGDMFNPSLPQPQVVQVRAYGEFYVFCGLPLLPPCYHPEFSILLNTPAIFVNDYIADVRIRATVGCIGFGTQLRTFSLGPGGRTQYSAYWVQVGAGSNICLGSTYAISVRFKLNDGTYGPWSEEFQHTISEVVPLVVR